MVKPFKEISPKDTLHVVTLYGATSYFIYRDEVLGYDYELAKTWPHTCI